MAIRCLVQFHLMCSRTSLLGNLFYKNIKGNDLVTELKFSLWDSLL